MATTYVKKIQKELNTSYKAKAKSEATDTRSKIARQADNLETRMSASGVSTSKVKDDRNVIEKALNLKPNQNILSDILETSNRSQQAIFGALDSLQKGEDIGKGFTAGLTGNKQTSGGQIFRNAGIGDSKTFGLDDILGFGADVVVDPMNLAVFPAVGKIATKAAEALDKANDIKKAADTALDVARTTGKSAEEIGLLSQDVANATKAVKRATKATKSSLGDYMFQGAAGAIGKVVKTSDNLIEKGLSKIDESQGINYLKPTAKRVADLGKEVIDGSKVGSGGLELYKGVKNTLTDVFDRAASMPKEVYEKYLVNKQSKSISQNELLRVRNQVNTVLDDTANEWAKARNISDPEQISKIRNQLDTNLSSYIEFKELKPTTTIKKLFSEDTEIPYTQEIASKLDEISKSLNRSRDFDIVKKGDRKFITLKNGAKEAILDDTIVKQTVSQPRYYTPEEKHMFKVLDNSKKFQQTYSKLSGSFKDANDIVKRAQGIDFNNIDMEGYVKHAINPDIKTNIDKINKIFDEFSYSREPMVGKTKTVAGRKYNVSMLEANRMFKDKIDDILKSTETTLSDEQRTLLQSAQGQDLFTNMFSASFDKYFSEIPELAKNTKIVDDVLVKATFDDPTIVRTLQKGEKAPFGFKTISTTDLKNKLETMNRYANSDAMTSFIKDKLNGNDYVGIDNRIWDMISFSTDEKRANALLQVYDKTLDMFKKYKLLSPGFQLRNLMGNSVNMAMSDMPINEIFSRTTDANKILNNADNLLAKVANGETLSLTEQRMLDTYKEFVANGFDDISKDLWELPNDVLKGDSTKKGIIGKVNDLNARMNDAMDKRYRLALMMYAKDNPSYLAKLGVDNAASAVREVLFDPRDLSGTEREVMRRIIPFYTFTKKNLAFQMKNLPRNSKHYQRIYRGINSLWRSAGINEDNVDEYKKNNWIPIPGLTKDGKYVAIKANLPVSDFGEFLSSPLQRSAASIAPLPRAMFEIPANTQLFSGLPIQEFKGQKAQNLPFVDRKTEYALSQFGLDTPIRMISDTVGSLIPSPNNPYDIGNTAKGLTQSFIGYGDEAKDQLSRDYDRLKVLQDYQKYLKQEGVTLPTITELQKGNKQRQQTNSTINSLLGK